MASNRNFVNFRAVYDELTDEVEQSREQFLPDHLENWFAVIDETPGVREAVKRIEGNAGLDRWTWIGNLKKSGVIAGNKHWPGGRDKRLALQLLAFREIVSRHLSVTSLAVHLIEGIKPEDAAKEVVKHIFMPMARELRRRLEAELAQVEEEPIPASDRTVSLDHNSGAYKDTIEALERLEKALVEANDYPDLEDKDQRIAEVSAARRLLKAARVRTAALVSLAKPLFAALAKQFTDLEIGRAASWAADKLGALLGSLWTGIF